jgi:Tfp pilus assembly protein PilV
MSVRSRQSTRSRRGVTLSEVLIGVLITAMSTVTFASVNISSYQAVARSQHLELATQIAHEELEVCRQAGYAGLPTIPTGRKSVTSDLATPTTLPDATAKVVYTRVDASLNPSTTATGRRRVDVTVTWDGSGNDRGSVTLTTLMTQE